MKRFVTFLFFGVIMMITSPWISQSQTVDDDIYSKETIAGKQPLDYVSLREADVMWSKKIWQMIDCRKRNNQILYFPLTDMEDRKSLIQVIMHGIDNEGLTAYRSDQFREILTKDEIYQEMGAGERTQRYQLPDGTFRDTLITQEIRFDEITKYMIREQWIFDRKYSDLRVRVVGICPIREYIDDDTGDKRKSQVFWIYYPEARNILAKWEVFNRKNDAQRVSFEDWFQQRRYDSYVVKESNVYGDRLIDEYKSGIDALLEAEAIRSAIFEFEHDLWEY